MGIRRAGEADFETLLALWDEFAAGPLPPWAEDARAGAAAGIAESIGLGAAFLAERDDDAIGFATAVARGSAAAELTELYVRPHARGRGVATALVGHVVAAVKAHGARHVFVSTGIDNDTARAVYERWGFRPHAVELVAALDELERLTR